MVDNCNIAYGQNSLFIYVMGTAPADNLSNLNMKLFESQHEISNNVICATSKGSVQPAHMRSLIRAFASRLYILLMLRTNSICSFYA